MIRGGSWIVDNGAGIARHFRVPEMLVGATVISIGTTLPEILVSSESALTGHSQIAYGNAIGSIICNTALIAALTLAIRPPKIRPQFLRTPVIFFFIAAGLYAADAYTGGSFNHLTGFSLVGLFFVYLIVMIKQRKKVPDVSGQEPKPSDTSVAKMILFLVLGAILITIGGNFVVDTGSLIAASFGVPESVIALTFVAVGTSLPELFTSVTALIKGHSSLSLGNVIGANLMNLVLVNGISLSLAPFRVPENFRIWGINSTLVVDLPLMFLVMIIFTAVPTVKGRLTRKQGIVLLSLYGAFCVYQFWAAGL